MKSPLHFALLTFAGWVNRQQDDVIEYLKEENRFLFLRQQLAILRLAKNTPSGREVQDVEQGKVVAFPQVGELHHRSERRAASRV